MTFRLQVTVKSTLQWLKQWRKAIFFFFFWLCWVFVAACGLSLVMSRGYSPVAASLCVGFSCRRGWTAVVAPHRLSCPEACGILIPGPGIEPVSPALQGGFLTTGLSGKPKAVLFIWERSLFLKGLQKTLSQGPLASTGSHAHALAARKAGKTIIWHFQSH